MAGGAKSEAIDDRKARRPAASACCRLTALRGFDMFWIIGGDALFSRSPNGFALPSVRSGAIGSFSSHVEWHGFHFYDLIFPLFLFVVAASCRSRSASMDRRAHGRLFRRARRFRTRQGAGALQFNFASNGPGVLQRIAICYGVAGLIVFCTSRGGQAAIVGAILLGYWLAAGVHSTERRIGG